MKRWVYSGMLAFVKMDELITGLLQLIDPFPLLR
jgi:hypothetical protein